MHRAEYSPISEALARIIVESSTDFAIITTDRNGMVTSWNIGAEHILGWSEADMLGQDFRRIYTSEDRERGAPDQELQTAIRNGRAEDTRWHARKDGSRFWASGITTPLRSHGKDGYVKILRDDTQKKQTEERLRENEALLQLSLTAAHSAPWVFDVTTDQLQLSPELLAFLGFPRGQSVRMEEIRSRYEPGERERIIAASQAALTAHQSHFEVEFGFRDVNNKVRRLLLRAQIIVDDAGQLTRVLGVILDITDRKRVEDELRQLNEGLEQRIREIIAERDLVWRLTDEVFVVMTPESMIDAANPAVGHLGYEVEEVVGQPVEPFIHPDDLASTTEAIARGATMTINGFENRIRSKDGQYRLYSWNISPAEGRVVSIGRDISEERRRREELERTQDALRQSQKLEAIGQLTGGVAHDFNNLLTVIRSSAELLRRHELSEEKKRRYIDAISDTADRAAKLTGQLLAFARRQALKPEVFDIGDRVRTMTDILRTVVGARVDISIQIECEETCYVEADPNQFETAIINIVVNARDAMIDEGRLTIDLKPVSKIPSVRGHAGAEGDFVALSISDTGSGIAADQLGRIFEPFFTTKEAGKGTGLGLSQVYGFAKQSGGEVRVESTVGEGTIFTLYLPRAIQREARLQEEKPKATAHPLHGQGKVLLVEDNAEIGEFASQLLADLGYEATWTSNAQAALDLLAGDPDQFDIVFTDVVMPGTSGLELAKELRRRSPDLPIILMSGYSHVLAQEGTHGFALLQKPYTVEGLSRVLSQELSARSAMGRSSVGL